MSRASGSLWPHQMATDGMVAEQVDGCRRLAHGLLADAAGVAPLEREVLPEQQAGLVGRVVELGPADVGVDAEQVEPGVLGRARRRRRARRRCASPSAMRVGPWLAPLRNSRSPLTLEHPVPHRRPGAGRCAAPRRGSVGLPRPRRALGGATSTAHVVEGLVAEGVGPPQLGVRDGDGPLDLVLARGQRLLEHVVDAADGGAQGDGRWRRRRRASARKATTARSAFASRQTTRRCRMRTGPVSVDAHRAPDAAGVPVRVQAVPVLEHAGDVALGAAVGLRAARHLDAEDVLVTRPRGPRSPRRCGGRSSPRCRPRRRRRATRRPGRRARRRQPVAFARWPACIGCSNRRRYSSGPSRVGEGGGRPPVAGDLDRLPAASSAVASSSQVRRRSSSATSAPQVPDRSIGERYRGLPGEPGRRRSQRHMSARFDAAARGSRSCRVQRERCSVPCPAPVASEPCQIAPPTSDSSRTRAGSPSRSRRRCGATPWPASAPASRCSNGSSATRTPFSRSWRTPCWPATT